MKPIYLHVLMEQEDGEVWKEFLLSCNKDPKSVHVLVIGSLRVDVRQVPEEVITKWMHDFVHSYWRLSDELEDLIHNVIDYGKFRSVLENRLQRLDEHRYNKRHWKSDYLSSEAISFVYNWTCEIEEQEWKLFPIVGYWSIEEEDEEDGA